MSSPVIILRQGASGLIGRRHAFQAPLHGSFIPNIGQQSTPITTSKCGQKQAQATHLGASEKSIEYTNRANRFSILNHISRRSLAAQKRKTLKVKVTELPSEFKMEWPKITLFGDSITRRSFDPDNGCWASHIAFNVGSYFDVDARGFEGYNTKWALELMPKLFPSTYLDKVALFVVFFGHNDSWESPNPLHVPVANYEANLRNIVKHLEDHGLEKSKIILITPTWYKKEEFDKFCRESSWPPVGKTLEEARKYSDTVQRVGRDLQVEVVDFFSTSLKQDPMEAMFCDGLHLSRQGAKLLADQLMPVIEKKLEARFGKALVDLWHAVPVDQHPEVKPFIEAALSGSGKQ